MKRHKKSATVSIGLAERLITEDFVFWLRRMDGEKSKASLRTLIYLDFVF
jgi:hypothetical protein